jgi:hypothetical protein
VEEYSELLLAHVRSIEHAARFTCEYVELHGYRHHVHGQTLMVCLDGDVAGVWVVRAECRTVSDALLQLLPEAVDLARDHAQVRERDFPCDPFTPELLEALSYCPPFVRVVQPGPLLTTRIVGYFQHHFPHEGCVWDFVRVECSSVRRLSLVRAPTSPEYVSLMPPYAPTDPMPCVSPADISTPVFYPESE